MTFRSGLAALTLALLLACESRSPFEPPPGTVEFDPPPVYATWWTEVEACAQRRGNFQRVRWFQVPGDSFICHPFRCRGLWTPEHHIYLAQEHSMDENTVKHEMLHDILNDGDHDHSAWDHCDL